MGCMKKLKQAFRKNPSKNNHSKTPPSPPSPPPKAQQAPVVEQQPPPEPQPQHQPPQPQPYHHIRLGQGGAVRHKHYRRGDPDPSLTCLGTTGTIDTVGVFFEMSDDRCFIAHIEAYTTRDSSPGEALYSVNFKSAAELRSMIIARLNWYFGGPTARMRDTLVMTCARLSGQEARCSEVAAKAVREWLGAGVSDGGRVAAAGTGFQVGWSAAGRFVFEQESGEQWGAVEYPLKEGQWCFVVAEEEIDPCDEAW